MKHKPGVWYPAEDTPDQDEQYTPMALLISGVRGGKRYERAIFLDEDNYFENGKFYVAGIYRKNIEIHRWYLIPLPEEI